MCFKSQALGRAICSALFAAACKFRSRPGSHLSTDPPVSEDSGARAFENRLGDLQGFPRPPRLQLGFEIGTWAACWKAGCQPGQGVRANIFFHGSWAKFPEYLEKANCLKNWEVYLPCIMVVFCFLACQQLSGRCKLRLACGGRNEAMATEFRPKPCPCGAQSLANEGLNGHLWKSKS